MTAVDPAAGGICRQFHVQGRFDRLLGGRTPQIRPALVGDRLFVGSALAPEDDADVWRYWLSGVALRTGEVAWTSDRVVAEEYVPPAVTADAERVYLPAANRLTAFGHNGERHWRTTVAETDRERRRRPPIASVATDGDRLFLAVVAADETGGVYARDAETGAARSHRGDLHGEPVVAGDIVYARHSVEVGEDEDASVLRALRRRDRRDRRDLPVRRGARRAAAAGRRTAARPDGVVREEP